MYGRQILRLAVYLLAIAGTSLAIHAQQRNPNQPTPTPTPITPQAPGQIITKKRANAQVRQLPAINGTIRWRKELGLPYDSTLVRPPYPICNMFHVLLKMQDPSSGPGTFGVTRTAYYRASGNLNQDGHYYTCSFEITKLNGVSLPLEQMMVITAELDPAVLRGRESGPWSVGGDASPPPGQQRAIIIIGGRANNGVTLTNNQPRATMDFEMVYRSLPAQPH